MKFDIILASWPQMIVLLYSSAPVVVKPTRNSNFKVLLGWLVLWILPAVAAARLTTLCCPSLELHARASAAIDGWLQKLALHVQKLSLGESLLLRKTLLKNSD